MCLLMLQHFGTVFFTVTSIDRKEGGTPPTVFLNVYSRTSRELIGVIRFTYDPNYSKKREHIRMAFDVIDLKDIDPSYNNVLEDIIIGGFIWLTMDNHYTYPFHPQPYMVVNTYNEDPEIMQMVNAKVISILKEIGLQSCEYDKMYIFSKEVTRNILSNKLRKKFLIK